MDQQQAPLINDSTGPRYLGIVTSIFSISIVLFSIRIYTRVVPAYKLNASDYISAVAVLAEVITFTLFATAVGYGFGRHSAFVTPEDSVKILQCLFGIEFAGLWASTFARISVACLLLQFAPSAPWKTILWMTIGFQIASIFTTEAFALLRCRPIQAIWEEVHGAHCLGNKIIWISGYLCTSIGIVGDLIFAIMPMFLIWRLNRSFVERCLVSFLLALGLFASGAGVIRYFLMETLDFNSPDIFRAIMPMFFWVRMEEVILIAASSAPFLKSSIEYALSRLGLCKFQNTTRELASYHSHHSSPKKKPTNTSLGWSNQLSSGQDRGLLVIKEGRV